MAQNKKKYVVLDEVSKVMGVYDTLKKAEEEAYGECVILEVTKQMFVDYEKVFIAKDVGEGLC